VEPPLLLLDEIDAGLGLDAARPVARLLGELARHGQVVCITHLPTMAVHGHRHWRAVKTTVDGRTLLDVRPVENEDRLRELERLLGGGDVPDDDRSQRDFAEKLLREAKAGTSSRN
jgi:DNA repair protein RecN (Recombination protein N)